MYKNEKETVNYVKTNFQWHKLKMKQLKIYVRYLKKPAQYMEEGRKSI